MSKTDDYKRVLPVLSARLGAIASLVNPSTERIIDIGTDHAYLPIYLVGKGICDRALASDLKPGPAAIARENVIKNGFEHQIEISIGDGLDNIDVTSEDTVIIAGMGGLEIMRILDRQLPIETTFILQPQKSAAELRIWLTQRGFLFEDEVLVKDRNHHYVIIKVTYPSPNHVVKPISDYVAWIGPVLLKKYSQDTKPDKIWLSYLEENKSQLAKAQLGKPELIEVLEQLEKLLDSTTKKSKTIDL